MIRRLFIVLDGVDGSGKGEQIKRLHNYLFSKSKKYRILTTREPTYGKYGKEVREILKKDKDPMKNAEGCLRLYVRDRAEHLKNVIEPFLASNNSSELNIVLCDRYYYSTIAFQNAQGISLDRLLEANKGFRKPDLALILDLPADVALERIKKARGREKFEELEFMKKLRKNFLELKEFLKDNIKIIDANKAAEVVFEDVKEEVDKLL